MKVTIISMYQGSTGSTFVQAVEGELSEEQKGKWRKVHICDEFYPEHYPKDDKNEMYFHTVDALPNDDKTYEEDVMDTNLFLFDQ